MAPLGVGVIGYGYWGPNLVRNFMSDPGWRVVSIADKFEGRLAEVGRLYPGVATSTKPEDVFRNPSIDAVAIATHLRLPVRFGPRVRVGPGMRSTNP